jgi:hypothetical protein
MEIMSAVNVVAGRQGMFGLPNFPEGDVLNHGNLPLSWNENGSLYTYFLEKCMSKQSLTHLMLDIETIGKQKDAAVVAIAAAFFDPMSDEVGNKFHMRINFNSALRHGTATGSTIQWWFQQDKQAQLKLIEPPQFEAEEAVDAFTTWLFSNCVSPQTHLSVWCHATFDVPVLENLFRAVGKPWPFSYRATKDLRTLQYLSPEVEIKREGVLHDALDDVLFQIKAVQLQLEAIDCDGISI